MNPEKKSYTFLHVLLVMAIALIANLFVFYSLEVIEPSPRFEEFCTEDLTMRTFNSASTCTDAGGQWTATPLTPQDIPEGKEVVGGYCNATYSCQKEYEKTNEEHAGLAFVVLTTIGGILFVLAMITRSSSVVSNGLGLGGLISIFWGSVTNWSYLYPLVKVGLLGALLALVLWFAWSKFKD